MLRFDLEEKFKTTLNRLCALRYVKTERLPVLYTDEVKDKQTLPVNCESWQPFETPFTLFETDKYYWFKANFEIPKHAEHERVYLNVETFINGVASTIRPQGLLYLNGEVTQGIDINHTEVLLKAGKYEMYLLFFTHTFIRSLPVHFSIQYVDERINSLCYDLALPIEGLRLLSKRANEYVEVETALERTVNLIDFRREYSKEFYESLATAQAYLKQHYYEELCGSKQTVNCIGHTHIDVAWMWTLDQTKEKVERSFATVLKLMEEYPEYKFMSSQPQLYAYLKERNPKLYQKVKEKIAEGRWEVEGAMWLEADCNLTSGESLVRQIVHGKRFFQEEFGKDCRTVWEPDVFGYSAALPQIMKKSGVDRFVTAKIGWNDTNRMPYDSFIWQGIDGSQVFAFLLSTCDCDPRNGKYDRTYTTYVGKLNAEQTLGTWNRYEPKEFNNVTMMAYGWGDGGGGPTRAMLENQRRLSYGLPGIPKTRMATVKESLDEIEANFYRNAKELKRMPKWNGEIYFEYHRGTYTSVPRNKQNNRKGEFALQNGEWASVLGRELCQVEYPLEQIDSDWKLLLLNQFHDILPGSSIEGVYKDSDAQYQTIFTNQASITENALNAVLKNVDTEGGVIVFNPNGFTANGTVAVKGETKVVKGIPAHGYKVVKPEKAKGQVRVENQTIENEGYRVEFTENGAIRSIYDKRFGREVVKAGELCNEMRVYEDMPYQYDNWELTPYYKQKEWTLDSEAEFTPIFDGDRAGYLITKKYYDSTIEQKVFLYAGGLERIDFVTNIDWKEKRQLLKARFPFNLLVDKATYDVQFGNLERSTAANTSWDAAKFETCGQKWVDFSENNYGVALLNDGRYGFGAEDSTLTITLLKSGSFPYDGASDDLPEFTYSLYPHGGDFREGGVVEAAYVLNRGLQAKAITKQSGNLSEEYSLVTCDTKGVFIETVKGADKGAGIVLRMFEAFKETKEVALRFGCDVKKAYICDMLENEETELVVENGRVVFPIKPFEIITLKVKTGV
ncbi:MAG: alpha-mannosidase [Clostridia bacterium]|nr:alpha-mannosidase [Clostridia bacterium]